jgi:hypothetical protein
MNVFMSHPFSHFFIACMKQELKYWWKFTKKSYKHLTLGVIVRGGAYPERDHTVLDEIVVVKVPQL